MNTERVAAFADDRLSGRLANSIISRPALTIAIIVSVLGFVGIFVARLIHGFANDFGVYWRTANGPISEAYSYHFASPFPYAPTMLLWISPLKLVGVWPAFFAWNLLSLWAMAKVCRPLLTRHETLLVLASPAFAFSLATGQVSIAMAALIVWACAWPNRIAAGVAFAVAASIKPQLVFMAPLLLLFRRDWPALISGALAFVALVVATIILYGPAIWWEWAASMPDFHNRLAETKILTDAVTPASAAEGYGLPALPFMLAGGAFGVALIWHCRNRVPLETATAIGAASLLAAPYALPYDLAILSPLLVVTAFRGRWAGPLGLANIFEPLPLVLAALTLWRPNKLLFRFPTRQETVRETV